MGYRVAHIGAFDMENLGDLLFSDVVAAHLTERLDIDEIVYFSPQSCTIPNTDKETHSVAQLESFHLDKPFDAIIVGGGDMVHLWKVRMNLPHISDDWILYDVLHMWVIPSLVASQYGIPLVWNAPGVPVDFVDTDNDIVNVLCQAVDYISVRDNQAKKVLSTAVPPQEITVVPDSVLTIDRFFPQEELAESLEARNLTHLKPGEYIFFQATVRFSDEQLRQSVEALQKIKKETGLAVLVQSIGYSMGDEEVCERIVEMSGGEFETLDGHPTQMDLLALLANAAFYIGGSLHGSIISSAYGVKNVTCNVFNYNKIEGFLELMSNSEACLHDMADVYEAFWRQKEAPQPPLLQELKGRVEKHFDAIASIISRGTKRVDENYPLRIADYIHASSARMEALRTDVRNLQEEVERLTAEKSALQGGLDELHASTSWKVTAPLRRIVSAVRK
ncbi:MAG: polysaccharide pyruvyl transferase family protein [Actinomycetaceae bacterium]|nr:polysaccharide pyruvyl transferase family protein [Actinomycetaceae bacterium]